MLLLYCFTVVYIKLLVFQMLINPCIHSINNLGMMYFPAYIFIGLFKNLNLYIRKFTPLGVQFYKYWVMYGCK